MSGTKIELDVASAKKQVQTLRQKATYLRKQGSWWGEMPDAVRAALTSSKSEEFASDLEHAAAGLTEIGERLDEIAEGIEKSIRAYLEASE